MYLNRISGNENLADEIVTANSDMMYAGIVSGNNTGIIWADDISQPAFCIVWSEHLKGFHFMGGRYVHIHKGNFLMFIDDMIVPFLHNKNIHEFEFSCDSPAWFPFIRELFSDREIKRYKQFFYKLVEPSRINGEISLPVGYEVFEINADFIHGRLKDIENREAILMDMEETWGSVPRFMERGRGYLAVQDNRICSFVTTRFRYKDHYCIGADTYEPHRRKGLSSYLSVSLFSNIVKHNGNVWWDCSAENIASQKTACKAGLTFSHEYEVLWFAV